MVHSVIASCLLVAPAASRGLLVERILPTPSVLVEELQGDLREPGMDLQELVRREIDHPVALGRVLAFDLDGIEKGHPALLAGDRPRLGAAPVRIVAGRRFATTVC